VPREREEELRLKRRARPAFVLIGQERIHGFLGDHGRVEPRRDPFGKHSLAECGRAFDG
jgi:hypothetical protein